MIGTLTVFIGTWIGSIVSFVLGRYVLHGCVSRLNKRLKIMGALDLVLKRQGFRFCILMRLCPLVPFNVYNYVMGGTSVSLKNYSLTFFAYIPICAVNVFVGTTIMSI